MNDKPRMIRIYQTDSGAWRYEYERDGKRRWASLHTRKETTARTKYRGIQRLFERVAKNDPWPG